MNLWKKWTSINLLVIYLLYHIRIKAKGKNGCPNNCSISHHCQYNIHIGKLEGMNDKIKAIQRKACGSNHLPDLAFNIMAVTARNS